MVPDDGEVVGGEVTVEGFFDAVDEGGHVLDVLFGHHVEGYQILVVVVVESVNLHDARLAGGILHDVVLQLAEAAALGRENKKVWVAVPVTRPTLQASRIARLSGRATQKPTRVCIKPQCRLFFMQTQCRRMLYIPNEHLLLLCF